MVTLSCLIVIAALFAQVATTAPASASPKAIDIIFFVIIMRLFVVVIHHTVLHLLQEHVRKSRKPIHSMPRKSEQEVPGPAFYMPPKNYVPVAPVTLPDTAVNTQAWVKSSQVRDAAQPPTGFASNTKQRLCESNWRCDKIFNVLSISFGFVFDLIWVSTLYFEMQIQWDVIKGSF